MQAYEDIVISAVLPKAETDGTLGSHIDQVLAAGVDASYFSGPHSWLWRVSMEACLFQTPLDEDMVASMLDQYGAPSQERQQSLVLFLSLRDKPIPLDKLRVVLPAFMEAVHAERLARSLERTAKILTEGDKVNKENLEGYKDAKKFLSVQLSELDMASNKALPTQEIRAAASEFLKEYNHAKTHDISGIMTGFNEIDLLTNGIQRGELWIMCGATGEGKTQTLLNISYNACINAGHNIAYISLEMPVAQVRRRGYTRHTNHPQFQMPGGLFYEKIKKGRLNIDEEKALLEVVEDFSSNPNYGKFHVIQVGKHETVPAIRERLTFLRSRHEIDLLVVDYASLISGTRRRNNRQDEIVEVIEALKALALTFNEGEGLAMLTANQISRTAKEEANKLGRYGINFASETSAIEKNADFLGWILRNDEMKAAREAKMGVSKYRDGASDIEFTVVERFESGLLCDIDDAP